MKKTIFIALGIFLLAATGSTAEAVTPTDAGPSHNEAAPLIKTSCTRCHSLTRICNKLGKNDRAYWDKTVTRMMGKGASLQDKNKNQVVDYLLSLQGRPNPICP